MIDPINVLVVEDNNDRMMVRRAPMFETHISSLMFAIGRIDRIAVGANRSHYLPA